MGGPRLHALWRSTRMCTGAIRMTERNFGRLRAREAKAQASSWRAWWIATVAAIVAAGCAATGGGLAPDSPAAMKEKVVAERANARWQALIERDYGKAYAYLQPRVPRSDVVVEVPGADPGHRVSRGEDRQGRVRRGGLQGHADVDLRFSAGKGSGSCHAAGRETGSSTGSGMVRVSRVKERLLQDFHRWGARNRPFCLPM